MTVNLTQRDTDAIGHENDAHHTYLLALGDALRPLGDPVEIQAMASRVLGHYLGANRVAYFDVRGDEYLIERDFVNGAVSIAGRYPVASFGERALDLYLRGEIAVANDVASDPDLSAEEHDAYVALQVGAYIGVPLIKNGKFVVGLGVHVKGPREWTPAEIALVEETAERTWSAVERARAEAALAHSERHYRLLFDSIDQGLCTIEVLFDENGTPHDYRFLDMNTAFEQQTGLHNAIGRRVRELAPLHETFWYDTYGHIAMTGEARRFEHAAEALNRFYDVFAFRVGAPEQRQVAVLFNDISERKRREANLAFLSDVSHELVRRAAPDEMMAVLGARIGSYLNISRCTLAEIDEGADAVAIGYEWHRLDLQGIRGVYRLGDYLSGEAQRSLRDGDALVVSDTRADARVNAGPLAAMRVASFICAPVIREGHWRFLLAVKHAEVREWRRDEIELIQELTSRIWTRLEQARAQEALQVSDARHRALFSQMLGGVAETDLDGRFTNVNRRYCEILGYSREELLRMSMRDVLYEPDRSINVERRGRLVSHGESFEIERRHVRKDGSIVWLHNSVSRLSAGMGRPLGIISVSLDISERKQHEEAVRRGAELLDFVIQHSPSGFYIVDADFHISHINAESQTRAFRNFNPAIGRPFDVAMRVLWPEPLATELIGIFRHTLATGEPYLSDDLVSPRADIDTVETYNWQLQRITMPDGRFAVVCFYYDTTRLREAERELREADLRKDEFLATLAHELRNPLAPIRNSLHILRLASGEAAGSARVHDMLERQVSHMVRLVDDLMEVSRITRGKFELRKERIDLADVVHSAVETSRPLIEAAGHQLVIDLSTEPLALEADAMRLAQVLANLLNNAAKYTDPGGGRIWLSAHREGAQAVVSVKDNGSGIPVDMLHKVFDLFTQAERSYLRTQGGLGIGLTLVRSIVHMHEGSIEARSEGVGRGSEFVVWLPLAGDARVAGGAASGPAATQFGVQHRILVVDDNHDSADSLGMVLQVLGADVQVVYGGVAALEALDRYRPSVVFLDIGMPEMDGYEVAEQMRRTPQGRTVTLIALTGWGQKDDLRRSKEAGFDCHLVKPVDAGALEALLGSLQVPRP